MHVATIGSFDGVHLGHRHVIGQVVSQARMRGLGSLVVTFPNHPLQVLRPDFKPLMLSPEDEKLALLRHTEIDDVALVEFTPQLAKMGARDFMEKVLKERLHVGVLLIGYDNHFGHDRSLGFDDYCQFGQELGIEVIPCDELPGGVSSTAIRQALLTGDLDTANRLLGYPYMLSGTVVSGFQNGRKLGFPTANLQVHPLKLIPENGVYLVRTPQGFGMLNIGTRPTLHNGGSRSIEVHIFRFEGDLYGETMQVELLAHLRKEQEFESLEALQQQLKVDELACHTIIEERGFSSL